MSPARLSASQGNFDAELARVMEMLAKGICDDPFSILGPHKAGGRLIVRSFLPEADAAWLVEGEIETRELKMERIHPAGVFEARCRSSDSVYYKLRTQTQGEMAEFHDPYRFGLIINDFDLHLLAEGTHFRLYEVLGAHPHESDGVQGTRFAIWAPNARAVSVVGDFNRWDGRRHPMRLRRECGVWELFIPEVFAGELYKFEIKDANGGVLPLKSDPLAFAAERRPDTASIVHGLPEFSWTDRDWLSERAATGKRNAPISIYEVHLGSWRRVPEEGNRFLSYLELADQLVPYVQDMGFTHVEFLPVSEHPFDGSWGYQPTALFAPSSRFGSPADFAKLIDAFHRAGIGVLLDWVPGHFPSDAHGLAQFDGTALYEHADPREGFHRDWNTLIYNFGRREVANFLIANALFWLRRFHIDGLRVDAVASMIYRDYSREPGEWVPNIRGGNENFEAVAMLQKTNELAYGELGDIFTVAEESTAWPGVSRPTYEGGLGFGYKWNMGWMHDTLHYMSEDPIHRRYHQNDLSFGLVYAFSENFILPLSHDEVVHGKGSLLARMPGNAWQKFANLRAYFGFMYAHPGKKLLFMGGEFAQEREWNFDTSLDWHLLANPMHRGIRQLIKDLNGMYRKYPALHALDCSGEGFEWIEHNDAENSVLSFLRFGTDRRMPIIAVSNFTPVPRDHYRIGVPLPGSYSVVLNSDERAYGGSGVYQPETVTAEDTPWQGRPHSIQVSLPGLSTMWLSRTRGDE